MECGTRRVSLQLSDEEARKLSDALNRGEITAVLGLLKEVREHMEGLPTDDLE